MPISVRERPTQLGRRVGVGSREAPRDRARQPDEIVVGGNLLAPVLVPRRTLLVDATWVEVFH